jgi:aryl-alcohol dehydrogenase-like predicted oxidoreductase
MWQTSGGWGRIDKDEAVDSMLKYTDAGLTTFDMADICIQLPLLLLLALKFTVIY